MSAGGLNIIQRWWQKLLTALKRLELKKPPENGSISIHFGLELEIGSSGCSFRPSLCPGPRGEGEEGRSRPEGLRATCAASIRVAARTHSSAQAGARHRCEGPFHHGKRRVSPQEQLILFLKTSPRPIRWSIVQCDVFGRIQLPLLASRKAL